MLARATAASLQPPPTTKDMNVPEEIKKMQTYLVLLNMDEERRRQCGVTISALLLLHGVKLIGRMGTNSPYIDRTSNDQQIIYCS